MSVWYFKRIFLLFILETFHIITEKNIEVVPLLFSPLKRMIYLQILLSETAGF